MTEKYISIRDEVKNVEKEIQDMKNIIEEKIDAGSVAGLKYYFDTYNAKLDTLVDLKINHNANINEYLANCLLVIAKNIARTENYDSVIKDMRFTARKLHMDEDYQFSDSDWHSYYSLGISSAVNSGVLDNEAVNAIEDICDYLDLNISKLEPKIFPLLSDDGKANYFNSFVTSYCSANLGYDFSKENFTEENYFIKTIFQITEADSSLGYLNKNNIENVDMIKSVLEKMNDMKDFDVLDDSIEQENATRIKNILQQVVSIAEPPTKSYNQELEMGQEDPDEFWYTGR